jgi:hypothetical protein
MGVHTSADFLAASGQVAVRIRGLGSGAPKKLLGLGIRVWGIRAIKKLLGLGRLGIRAPKKLLGLG